MFTPMLADGLGKALLGLHSLVALLFWRGSRNKQVEHIWGKSWGFSATSNPGVSLQLTVLP